LLFFVLAHYLKIKLMSDTPRQPVFETTLPTGRVLSFREQNGDDDEILSRIGDSESGDGVTKFVQAIVKQEAGKSKNFSLNEIDLWPIRDKYALLIKSRIQSLGPKVEFKHTCSKCKKETAVEEDLSIFDWDFKQPFPNPKLDPEAYTAHSKACRPYNMSLLKEGHIYLTLSSGKEVRYKYLDGAGEKIILATAKEDLNLNLQLTARGLEWKNENNKYQKVERFNIFSAKDMADIRRSYNNLDPAFEGISELPCQHCKQIDLVNIVMQPDFFFPQGI
jgi:hypothetical protein